MEKKTIKFQDSLGEYLEGCESTKVTLKAIIIDITLDQFELESNKCVLIHIMNDIDGWDMLDEYNL